MKSNVSLKRIICLLLALLMLLATVGCKDKKKGGKKIKVIKKVVVTNKDKDEDNSDSSTIIDDNDYDNDYDDDDDDDDDDYDNNYDDEDVSDEEDASDDDYDDEDDYEDEDTSDDDYVVVRSDRPLPEIKQVVEKYVEKFEPEFDYEYVDWAGPKGYVIVYSHSEPNNRIPAANLVTYFKDKYNVTLEYYKDTDAKAKSAKKKILVGDTAFYTSKLDETEYAVTLKGDNLIFEGGHYAMVEAAEEWFETIKVKSGKVAVLNGSHDDFKSSVKLSGKKYNYVWGDEFDGDALVDNEKWNQSSFSLKEDMAMVHGDRHFHAVENGRLRLTADCYYDETNGDVRYATSGSTSSSDTMSFRNGYVEVCVRMPYAQGGFPAIWTMSSDNGLEARLPNYDVDDGYGVYKNRVWDLEFDLFESFSDEDKWTTTIHKWYTNIESYDATTGIGQVLFDFGDGKGPINMTDKILYPGWNDNESQVTKAYYWSYRNDPDSEWCATNSGGSYEYLFTEEEQKTINNEYHVYSYLYTGDHCTVYFDGEVFLDWDWDPNFDYVDHKDISKNNNGVGYNLWHYMIFDMMIYTPARTEKLPQDIVTPEVMPHNMFIDWIRIYQDPTDDSQDIFFPNVQE